MPMTWTVAPAVRGTVATLVPGVPAGSAIRAVAQRNVGGQGTRGDAEPVPLPGGEFDDGPLGVGTARSGTVIARTIIA